MATSGRDADGKPLLNDGSFAGMLSRYGFEFEEKTSDRSGYFAINPNGLGYNILTMPWYFANIGAIYPDFGTLGNVNVLTWVWSSSSVNMYYSYDMFVQQGKFAPNGYDDMKFGFSLRYSTKKPLFYKNWGHSRG